ncbi:MAG: lactonase family protein [Oscillospiraceae bacterium]|nr:lactonase family protein [Oscillospiraceae bacterium]
MAKYKIFIGTYSKGPEGGLLYGIFDSETGELCVKDKLDIENPAYMQISPQNGDVLYGVSETMNFGAEEGGALFSVDISDPARIRLIDIKGTRGTLPCHLCARGGFVFTANYADGSLSIMESGDDGEIKPVYRALRHFGKGPNAARQEGAHVHFASMDPGGKYLAVCDLGLDKVFLYPYFSSLGISAAAKITNCPPGSGPRHLAFSADGGYMYVLTELAGTVLVYSYNNGDTEFLQEISCLPPGKTDSTAAAVHISPDGKSLAASNRGADSLALFDIKENGALSLSRHIENQDEPRDFNFSPDGKWLVSAHQHGDKAEIFKIENGSFIKTGQISAPSPVCVLFGAEI